jgi:hypothetical protein
VEETGVVKEAVVDQTSVVFVTVVNVE